MLTVVGWIGLGAMGLPMAKGILAAGYSVLGYDRDASRTSLLAGTGGEAVGAVQDLARRADFLFSMAWDDDSLDDIVCALESVPGEDRRCTIFVDLSTVSVGASAKAADRLAALDIEFLRCPVSGSVAVAEKKQLSAFVSGPRAAYERVALLLPLFSSTHSYVGAAEEARVIKLGINLLMQMNTAALGEAMTFATKAGVDRRVFLESVNASILASPHYKVRSQALLDGRMDFGSRGVTHKDVTMAMNVAHANNVVLPIATLVQHHLRQIQRRDTGLNPIMELLTLLEESQ